MHPLSWHTGSNGCSSEKARVNRGRWPNTSMRWRHSSENKRKQRQHFANAFQGLHPRLPHCIGPCAGMPDQPGMPLDRPGSTGTASIFVPTTRRSVLMFVGAVMGGNEMTNTPMTNIDEHFRNHLPSRLTNCIEKRTDLKYEI